MYLVRVRLKELGSRTDRYKPLLLVVQAIYLLFLVLHRVRLMTLQPLLVICKVKSVQMIVISTLSLALHRVRLMILRLRLVIFKLRSLQMIVISILFLASHRVRLMTLPRRLVIFRPRSLQMIVIFQHYKLRPVSFAQMSIAMMLILMLYLESHRVRLMTLQPHLVIFRRRLHQMMLIF